MVAEVEKAQMCPSLVSSVKRPFSQRIISRALLQLGLAKGGKCFFFSWRMHDVARCEVICLRVRGPANAIGSSQEVIASVPELDVWIEQQPISPGFADGHSDAASIHNPGRSNLSIKLHVSVAADHHLDPQSFKKR